MGKEGAASSNSRGPKQPLAVDTIDAKLQSLEYQYNLAGLEYNRYIQLKKNSLVSQEALDEASTKLKILENDIKSLKSDRAILLQHTHESEVLAPWDGRVLKVFFNNGSVVLAGDIITEIAFSGYILRLNIPEQHAHYIKAGEEIKVLLRDNKTNISGIIQKIYPKLEQGYVIADVLAEGLDNYLVSERITTYIPTMKRTAIVVPNKFVYKKHGVTYARLKNYGEVVVQLGGNINNGVEILSGLYDGDILLDS